jgi:hypothetical protein
MYLFSGIPIKSICKKLVFSAGKYLLETRDDAGE